VALLEDALNIFANCLSTEIDLPRPPPTVARQRDPSLGLGQGRRRWLIHPPMTQFLAVSKVKQSEWLSRAAANRAQRPTTMAGATMPKRTQ